MTIDKAVMMFAGVMILVSLALAVFVNIHWLWLTAFIGVNLIQAPLTLCCPAARLFYKMKMKCGSIFCYDKNSKTEHKQ